MQSGRENSCANRPQKIGDPIDDSEAMFGGGAGKRTDQLVEQRTAVREHISLVRCSSSWHWRYWSIEDCEFRLFLNASLCE